MTYSMSLNNWHQHEFHWSEYAAWKWDKREWYRRYVLGSGRGEEKHTPELDFGKSFALALERGENMHGIELPALPEYNVKTKYKKVKLGGTLDGWTPDKNLVHEFKTGVQPWTQKRADDHEQLDFYAMLLMLAHKINPDDLKMTLIWFPTERVNHRETLKTLPNGELVPEYVYDITWHRSEPFCAFETRRSRLRVLKFIGKIMEERRNMVEYIKHMQA